MGGHGSGSASFHCLIEHSRRVTISSVVRAGGMRLAQDAGGCRRRSATPVRCIMEYTFRSGDVVEEVQQTASLITTRPYFGGVRWWFACPRCLRRCANLYLAPGARRFACRRCLQLRYLTQRVDCGERLHLRARRLVQRLGGEVDPALRGNAVTWKPRGMHQRTFERLYKAYQVTLQERHDWFGQELMRRFGPRLERLH